MTLSRENQKTVQFSTENLRDRIITKIQLVLERFDEVASDYNIDQYDYDKVIEALNDIELSIDNLDVEHEEYVNMVNGRADVDIPLDDF